MRNAYYLFIDIIAFFLFAFLHTFLASFKVKNFFARLLDSKMAFYRLAYNIISLWLVFYLFENLPRPDVELFDLKFPWDFIILIPQFLSLIGIFWTLRYFSFFEFAGFLQIKRWKEGKYFNAADNLKSDNDYSNLSRDVVDETLTLKIDGPYKIVRHPLYLFTIVFLILRPTMDLFYLVFLIFLIVYFYVGSFYEESKLVTAFGDQYKNYQKSVPRLFPLSSSSFHFK
jgi:methanethiol S-methyltransferase